MPSAPAAGIPSAPAAGIPSASAGGRWHGRVRGSARRGQRGPYCGLHTRRLEGRPAVGSKPSKARPHSPYLSHDARLRGWSQLGTPKLRSCWCVRGKDRVAPLTVKDDDDEEDEEKKEVDGDAAARPRCSWCSAAMLHPPALVRPPFFERCIPPPSFERRVDLVHCLRHLLHALQHALPLPLSQQRAPLLHELVCSSWVRVWAWAWALGMGMGMGMVPRDGAEENSKAVSTEAGRSGWGRKRGERGEKESEDERNSQILVSMH